MVKSFKQAERIQGKRIEAGLKGRSKAVRRWFKRNYGVSIDACAGMWTCTAGGFQLVVFHTDELRGDFTGCRDYVRTLAEGRQNKCSG